MAFLKPSEKGTLSRIQEKKNLSQIQEIALTKLGGNIAFT